MNRRHVISGGAATVWISALIACTTLRLPEFASPPPDRLQIGGDKQVEIKFYPMRDVTEQKNYFGTDLTPKKVLPIWLSISNRSTDTFAFDFGEVRINAGDSTVNEPQRSREPINTAGEQGLVLAGAALVSLPLMFAAVKMLSDSSEIQRNIMEKQIYSTTISPNQSVHGFIYTSIDPANPLATGYILTLLLRRVPVSTTDQAKSYSLRF